MDVAARIREILIEQRREIRSQIEGLVEDISYKLEDEGIDPSEIHSDVVQALRDLLGDPSTFPIPTPVEKRQLRTVMVSINATLRVDAESPEDLEDQLDDVRDQASSFGCDDVSVSGDYASSPEAFESDEDGCDD